MSRAAVSEPPGSWLECVLSGIWPGSRSEGIGRISGDASSRRFWRVSIKARDAPATAVVVDLGPDDLPMYARALGLYREPLHEPPFLSVHRFLESLGAPVPKLYHAALRERLLLIEDVGDDSLFAAATQAPAQAADLYRLAVDELLRLHVEGTARPDASCVAFAVHYDERLFGWELEQFIELGIDVVAPGADRSKLRPELAALARRLGRLPRVFSHRDYHGGNLFVQNDPAGGIRIRILDFQDALMAPRAQDLALLLTTRDAARVITPEIEGRLLDYYLAGLARRSVPALERAEFLESYRLCVLQHALKMLGRFPWLEGQGKHGYAVYMPCAAGQARRMLAAGPDFPELRKALGAAT